MTAPAARNGVGSPSSAPPAPLASRSFACSPITPGSSSPRSPHRSGRPASRTREAARWIGGDVMPDDVARMTVLPCDPRRVTSDDRLLGARLVRGRRRRAGVRARRTIVLTNAKNYRMDPDVPLVIAEVNPSHLDVLDAQRRRRGWTGGDRRQRQLRVDRRRAAAGAASTSVSVLPRSWS